MKYIIVKLRSDLLRMFPQFLAVFLMALLSVTVFSGMEGVWNGMTLVSEQYYEDTNLSDAWVYASGIDDDLLMDIQNLSSISRAERTMNITVDVVGNNVTDLNLVTIPDKSGIKLLHRSGTKYDADMEGIWLDESYAVAHNLKVGNTVTLSFIDVKHDVEIVGLILHPEFIYFTGSPTSTMPDSFEHGYAFIAEQYAEELFGFLYHSEMRLWVNEGSDLSIIKSDVRDVLGDNYITFQDREEFTSTAQMEDEIEQTKRMATMFSFVFIVLALLTMYTTMSRLVRSQRIQIGTMKAIGYSNFAIRMHYALYGLVIPIIGGLLGIGVGRLLVSNALIAVKKTTLTLPEWEVKVSWVSFAVILIIVTICIASTLFAANHSLKGLPAETMREEKRREQKKQKITYKKSSLSYEWKWVLRDIARNKTRYAIAVIGVAGSMMLMIAGFGMKDSLDYSNSYVFGTQYQYNYKAVLKNYSDEIYDDINKMGDSIQWIQESGVEIILEDTSVSGVLTIMESGSYIYLETKDGEPITLPDVGVVLTNKYAKKLGASVGDTLRLEVTGVSGTQEVEIVGIAAALTPQGIYISQQAWESLGNEYIPTSVLGSENSYQSLNGTDYFKEVTSIEKQEANLDELTESVNTIIVLLIAASLLLSVVILYNLGMLNFVERYREYATMKVMGYRKSEIRNIVLRDWMATTLPGYLLGIPIGFGFLNVYLNVVSFDAYEWLTRISLFNFILISAIIVGCSLCVNLYISRKVQKIIMTEALKSIE